MSKIKEGQIVVSKGGNNRPMRVLKIIGDDVIVEYIYKINYRGEEIYSKKGEGVREKVKIWSITERSKITPDDPMGFGFNYNDTVYSGRY